MVNLSNSEKLRRIGRKIGDSDTLFNNNYLKLTPPKKN